MSNRVPAPSRLERLPWTPEHTKLLILLTLGEFFELYDWFVGGFVAVPLTSYYHVNLTTSIYYTVAIFFLGAFVGCILFTYIGDSMGRKTALIVNMAIAGLGFLLTPFMPNIYLYGLMRFITGLGVGPESILVVDVMTTEFFPAKIRGRALARAYTAAWTAPIVVAVLSYYLLPHKYVLYGWQWLYIIAGLGIVLIVPWRFLIPESPRWLENRGRYEEADKIVARFEESAIKKYGPNLPPPVPVEITTVSRVPIRDLFRGEYAKRTIMLWIFEFLQTGVYYGFASLAPSVLYMKGITFVKTLQYSILIYTGYFISSIISMFIIDSVKFDRKWQTAGIMLAMGVVGLTFGFSSTIAEAVSTGFLFALLANIFSNAYHQYAAELYPTRIRAFADGVQYSLSRLGNYVWLTVLPIVLTTYGPVAMYAIVFILAIIVFLDIGLLGPRASQIVLEKLSK
ncbi:MFS transporter [Vulcanisaeta thermophila]|uniref:MFS transporter n=1 Tax=Vulcanisaeta thermophila TaxID=867917 RepID=UPI000853AD32|nr:MFS transporter [Vulcanisaeta thermophila]